MKSNSEDISKVTVAVIRFQHPTLQLISRFVETGNIFPQGLHGFTLSASSADSLRRSLPNMSNTNKKSRRNASSVVLTAWVQQIAASCSLPKRVNCRA